MEKIPRHVAIIMDGNGRWAKARGLPRTKGHEKGVERAKQATEFALEIGIEVLTLYAFSTENWARPRDEVQFLMALLEGYLEQELPTMVEKGIRFRPIGRAEELPASTRVKVEETVRATRHNDRLLLNLALSYGGRTELIDTFREIALLVSQDLIKPRDIGEEIINEHLYTAGQPEPDLLIRTSGEYRISNFLLWQLAYTELYFTHTLWPDFDRGEFLRALLDFQKRERRFGRLREGF